MIGNPTCMDCDYLRHTSPEQVFWKCSFWSGNRVTTDAIPDEWQDNPRAYVWLHCHMQPNAKACHMFRERVRKCRTFAQVQSALSA